MSKHQLVYCHSTLKKQKTLMHITIPLSGIMVHLSFGPEVIDICVMCSVPQLSKYLLCSAYFSKIKCFT